MQFTHKPTVIGGEISDPSRDREALLNGHRVGRVKHYSSGPAGRQHWKWTTLCMPAGRGEAPTLDTALVALKADVAGKIIDGLLPMSGKYADIIVNQNSKGPTNGRT